MSLCMSWITYFWKRCLLQNLSSKQLFLFFFFNIFNILKYYVLLSDIEISLPMMQLKFMKELCDLLENWSIVSAENCNQAELSFLFFFFPFTRDRVIFTFLKSDITFPVCFAERLWILLFVCLFVSLLNDHIFFSFRNG